MKRVLVALIVLGSHAAWAHKPSDAQLRLAVDGATVRGRIDVAIRDLDGALGLDADGNGEVTWGEAHAAAPQIAAYLRDRLAIATETGEACPIALGAAALADLSDGTYWAVPVTAVSAVDVCASCWPRNSTRSACGTCPRNCFVAAAWQALIAAWAVSPPPTTGLVVCGLSSLTLVAVPDPVL